MEHRKFHEIEWNIRKLICNIDQLNIKNQNFSIETKDHLFHLAHIIIYNNKNV